MKTLILGANGQLGKALADAGLGKSGVVSLDRSAVNIADADNVLNTVREIRPDFIVNAAAYTAVDKAEAESELAAAVNCEGPRNVALAARDCEARLIHISTDFVFDGDATSPYKPDAETNPQSVYGRTKRDGELAVLELMPESAAVVRTAWLYSATGNNFVNTMLRLMRERPTLSVVADQIGTPTWANSLAEGIWRLVGKPGLSGVYHWTDTGQASWHEFATAIRDEALELGLLDRSIEIKPITTDEYPTAAARPRYSVLDCSSTYSTADLNPRHWRINLKLMLEGLVN
tara:strand:- start:13910 stop:14776 length:867 start_codon:yes stop_codon:yes gene_type:complete